MDFSLTKNQTVVKSENLNSDTVRLSCKFENLSIQKINSSRNPGHRWRPGARDPGFYFSESPASLQNKVDARVLETYYPAASWHPMSA